MFLLGITSSSTIELGLILTLLGIVVGVLIHLSQSITKLAYREGKTEEKINNLTDDVREMRESHQQVFQFLLRSADFKESLNRRPR